MADKQIEIELVTKAELDSVDELKDKIDEIKQSAEEGINLTANIDNIQAEFDEATAEVERLQAALEEAELNGDDIEADIISDELAEATARAEELGQTLALMNGSDIDDVAAAVDGVSESTITAKSNVDSLENSIDSLDGSGIGTVSENIDSVGKSIDSASNSMDNLDDHVDSIDSSNIRSISADMDSVGESADSASDSVDSLNNSIGSIDGGNVNDVVSDMDSVDESASSASISTDSLNSSIDSIDGSNVNGISLDIDSIGESADSAESSVDNLGNDINSLDGSNVQSIASDFTEVGSEADNADMEVQELANSMSLLEAGALMGISSELSSLGGQAEGMAQEMNTAAISVGQLATQTGIAEPQMVSLVNTISNATFPNDEAMMYIKSLDQIGVASNNLGQSATDLDKINDAFGLGANKVNSLGQELSVLGVDMNNVSSSFNALAYANANTVGGMENYYTFLRKYDSQFKELGFNVDQASVIIAAATQKFGGGRAALSGLNDALKESNGDTRALEEALGLEAGALENATQLTGQYEGQLQTLADEEAEHKTLLDQINAAWEDLSLSLSPVLAPLTSFMGIIGQVGSYATAINSLIKLKSTIMELSIVDSFKGKLTGLASGLRTVASSAKTAMIEIGTFAKELAVTAASAIKDAIIGLAQLAKNVLLAGLNAMKSAAMWALEKAAMIASTAADYAAAAAQWALNIAMDANPIMLVVLAITALVAILAYLYFNNEQVRAAVDALGAALYNIANTIWGVVTGAIQWLSDLFSQFTSQIGLNTNDWKQAVLGFILFIPQLPLQIGIALANAIAKALGFKGNFASTMLSAAQNAVNNFASGISGLVGKLQAELDGMISAVRNFAGTIGSAMWEAATNAWNQFLSGLGIHSPGIMQRTLVWEVSEMGRRVPLEGKTMVRNLGKLASDAVDSFGNPALSIGYDDVNFSNGSIDKVLNVMSNRGNGDIIINIEGDVDSEKRVNQIVEVIRKELAWNNNTAGRNV